MPVIINEVINDVQPANQASTPQNASAESTAPAGEIDFAELLELQAVQQSRQQRLEVD